MNKQLCSNFIFSLMVLFVLNNHVFVQVNKLTINDSCSESSTCNEQAGLSCLSGTCSCPINQYFKDQTCQNVTSSTSAILNYFGQDLIFTRTFFLIVFFC